MTNRERILALDREKTLSHEDWTQLIATFTEEELTLAKTLAASHALSIFGRTVYFRGLIEITNVCKNDCYYCGIRRSNANVERYSLTEDDILACCAEGYASGFRTFVLQGGETGSASVPAMVRIVTRIKEIFTDCAVTLSLGELTREDYARLREAGADRYLLRHEAASPALYRMLHPAPQALENRMRCLYDLRSLGYQVGCGFMVGVPHQTPAHLAEDMKLLEDFQPEMVGIGPFIPHKDTPFGIYPGGSVPLTLFLMSLTRILLPKVLLPATTALGTAEADGRTKGILAGCNVIMPALTPTKQRRQYMLYNNKAGSLDTAEESIRRLRAQMDEIEYTVAVSRGDHPAYTIS